MLSLNRITRSLSLSDHSLALPLMFFKVVTPRSSNFLKHLGWVILESVHLSDEQFSLTDWSSSSAGDWGHRQSSPKKFKLQWSCRKNKDGSLSLQCYCYLPIGRQQECRASTWTWIFSEPFSVSDSLFRLGNFFLEFLDFPPMTYNFNFLLWNHK